MMKKIMILGSTGSIGTQTLEAMRYNRDIQATALVAGSNVKLLEERIREFKPRLVCLQDEKKAKELWATVADMDAKVANGMEGLMETAVTPEADLVVTVVVGMIRIRPTTIAMEAGKGITLTNKETLVTVDHIIIPLARGKDVKLLPADLEHSAIFQCLQGVADSPLHEILLTASDGPFRGFIKEQLEKVRLGGALGHPNWPMEHKTTMGSSTMVSKRLGAMETCWLFGTEMDQMQAVVQPVSIIRSMVEFENGAVITRLDMPDMRLPTQYALYCPEHRLLSGDRLDFEKLTKISFKVPDMETSRDLRLAYEVRYRGGTLSVMPNAANEMVVAMFLERRINYLAIVDMTGGAAGHHCIRPSPDVAQVLEAEQETCDYLSSKWNQDRNRVKTERRRTPRVKRAAERRMDR